MRALIVDDSVTARLMLAYILKTLGFETEEAPDGSCALDRLREAPAFDLMTLDWNMPGLNGGQILDALQAEPALRPTRVLVVTSETEMRMVARSMDRGCDEYLMKPFSAESVGEKIGLMGLIPSATTNNPKE
jgi:two-component system chemotaxis response regulator CheY